MAGARVGSGQRPPLDDQVSESGWGRRFLPRVLSSVACTGALLGSLNLVFDGALKPGTAPRVVYAAMMATCLLAAVAIWWRPSMLHRAGIPIVALSDTLYVVISWTIADAQAYSTPLMLLFTALLAAWLLEARTLPLQAVAVYSMCLFVLNDTIADGRLLAVQVIVQGSVLNMATLLVYLLRRRSERLLSQMHLASVTDILTGLPNRRSLKEKAPSLWQGAAEAGQRVAALVLDLDHFKAINDHYGHATGDDVLRELAVAVRSTLRAEDLVARIGGEEFVVLTSASSPEPVVALAGRIHTALADRPVPVPVTMSIGIALDDGLVSDPVEASWRLIDRADHAMYEAKSRGRNMSVLLRSDSDEMISLVGASPAQRAGRQAATT
jgi:diguanylate cyclase (GGDEF)-like protein